MPGDWRCGRCSALAAFKRGASSLAVTLSRRAIFFPLALNVFALLVAVRLLGLTGRVSSRSIALAATNIPLILPGCAFAGVLSSSLARLTGFVALLFATLSIGSPARQYCRDHIAGMAT
jgi:hypothetical protein